MIQNNKALSNNCPIFDFFCKKPGIEASKVKIRKFILPREKRFTKRYYTRVLQIM